MQTESGASPGSQLLPVLSGLVDLLRQLQGPEQPSSVALTVLRLLAERGPGRVTDLARLARVSQPGMTQLVGRMEKAGLVRRVADPGDGRAVLVELTAAGREQRARTFAYHAATLDTLFERLDPRDSDVITQALPALIRLVDAGHAERPGHSPSGGEL
ncbi:MarR family transcriptional regulator [Dactylosporangium sp. NPDC050588]|uniref:MarR family winged helix-turn-helix transcriptional regulator n=1 Tax=Dactylosporangium sp. NPDC050588 TaxID=3157211 RepID=UPI00340E3FB9